MLAQSPSPANAIAWQQPVTEIAPDVEATLGVEPEVIAM